jgi:4a-hydroxytetrahydrobiopterin dehydratase
MRPKRLTEDELGEALKELKDWTREGEAIKRQFTFASFPDAISFATRLAFEAEAADHHPDLAIEYKRVTLTYSTHSEGGLTANDVEGARTADRIAARFA